MPAFHRRLAVKPTRIYPAMRTSIGLTISVYSPRIAAQEESLRYAVRWRAT